MIPSLLSSFRQKRDNNRHVSDSFAREAPESDTDTLLGHEQEQEQEHNDEERSSIDQDATDDSESTLSAQSQKPVISSWAALPNKTQIIVLSLVRFAEILYQSSTRTYLFYQLKWFDPSLPESVLSSQSGIIQGSSTFVQIFSAIIVGRLADRPSIGRKPMLVLGLLGYAISSIGLAFSKSFTSALLFQAAGGVLDGNAGLVYTLIAETVSEKEHQSRAFMLLPLFANVGATAGFIVGGVLADPVHSYPSLFKPGYAGWFTQWPYAPPGICNALLCSLLATILFLGLDETHEVARYRKDWGRQLGRAIARCLHGRRGDYQYSPLWRSPAIGTVEDEETATQNGFKPANTTPSHVHKASGLAIFLMPTVLLTLIERFLFNFHSVTSNTLSLIFFPAARASPLIHHGLHFGGGLGLTTAQVGLTMSTSGFMIIPLSLIVYPKVSSRLGILRSYLIFLPVIVVLYAATPFMVFVPDRPLPVWIALGVSMLMKAVSRTFTSPGSAIILNNCVPNPSVRATVNGVGSSIAHAAVSVGPVIGGWGLGLGLKYNLVGAAWWGLAVVGLVQWLTLWQLRKYGLTK